MNFQEFVLGIVFMGGMGAGFTFATSAHEMFEFWVARGCFFAAGLAAEAAYYSWLIGGSHKQITHVTVFIVASLCVLVGVPEAIWWTNFREYAELKRSASDYAWFTHRSYVAGFLIFPAAAMVSLKAPRLWRLRAVWLPRWRVFAVEIVWISRQSALDAVSNSQWAKSRANKDMSLSNLIGFYRPDPQFARFCRMALDGFESSNPSAVQDVDGEKQYDQAKLSAFLAQAFDDDVTNRFGAIPHIRI